MGRAGDSERARPVGFLADADLGLAAAAEDEVGEVKILPRFAPALAFPLVSWPGNPIPAGREFRSNSFALRTLGDMLLPFASASASILASNSPSEDPGEPPAEGLYNPKNEPLR